MAKVNIFKNSHFLIIGLLLVIIVILLINNYFCNTKRTNIVESFECNSGSGEEMINEECICIKDGKEFIPNDINCNDMRGLLACQTELCRDKNFVVNSNNCGNFKIVNNNGRKACCNNNDIFKKLNESDKSLCIPYDLQKFCTLENKDIESFSEKCCTDLDEKNSVKSTFCKAACTGLKTNCNTLPDGGAAKNVCMSMYTTGSLNCPKYDVES